MNEHGGSSSEQPKKRQGNDNGAASRSELASQTASVVLSGSEIQSSTSTSQQTAKKRQDAERACPQTIKLEQWKWLVYTYWNSTKQRERSEKNRANALSKKIQSACGAKSIARIIHELEVEAELESQREDEHEDNEPLYMKLWDKSKRHKMGKFDDEAEVKFNEFRELHEKEVGEKGADALSLDEAFEKVLGQRSGYARDLGKGHPVLSKNGKKGRAELESNVEQLQAENNAMQAEIT